MIGVCNHLKRLTLLDFIGDVLFIVRCGACDRFWRHNKNLDAEVLNNPSNNLGDIQQLNQDQMLTGCHVHTTKCTCNGRGDLRTSKPTSRCRCLIVVQLFVLPVLLRLGYPTLTEIWSCSTQYLPLNRQPGPHQ